MDSGALKSKVFIPDEVGSDLPVTMWYFDQSFGVVCKVPPRSSSHEGLCLLSPKESSKYHIVTGRSDATSSGKKMTLDLRAPLPLIVLGNV